MNIELKKLPGRDQTQDRGARVLRHPDLRLGADRLLAGLAGAVRAAAPDARARAWTCASTSSSPATDNLDYSFERIKGVQNMLLGGSGFFMDKFRATDGDALVWLHGHGNVFLVSSTRASRSTSRPAAWLYKDPTVKLEAITMGLKTGIFGGGGKLTWNRFTRPRAPRDPDDVHRAARGRRLSTAGAAGAGRHRRRADRRSRASRG